MMWRNDIDSAWQTRICCVRKAFVGGTSIAAIGMTLTHATMKPADEGPPST